MVKKSKKLKKVPEKKRKRFEELAESPQKDLKKHKLQQQEIIKEPILIQLAQSTFHELTQNSTEEEYIEISATKDALEIEEENNSTFEEAKGNILDKVEPIPTQLSLEDWEARECGSDGNCFYRSICYLLNYSPDDHLSLRKKTIINIRNKIDDYLEYYFDEGVNLEEYLQNQSRSKQYTGEFEIRSLSDCIKRTIVIFIPTYSNNIVTAYKFYQLYGNEYYSSNSHFILRKWIFHERRIRKAHFHTFFIYKFTKILHFPLFVTKMAKIEVFVTKIFLRQKSVYFETKIGLSTLKSFKFKKN